MPIYYRLNTKTRLMLCQVSGLEIYCRWVPLFSERS